MPLGTARTRYASQAPSTIDVRERDTDGINGPMQSQAVAEVGMPVTKFLSSVGAATAANSLRTLSTVMSASLSDSLSVPAAAPAVPSASALGRAGLPGAVIKKN
jgi:hypothetical protein